MKSIIKNEFHHYFFQFFYYFRPLSIFNILNYSVFIFYSTIFPFELDIRIPKDLFD